MPDTDIIVSVLIAQLGVAGVQDGCWGGTRLPGFYGYVMAEKL